MRYTFFAMALTTSALAAASGALVACSSSVSDPGSPEASSNGPGSGSGATQQGGTHSSGTTAGSTPTPPGTKATPSPPVDPGTAIQTETWADGKHITGPLTVAAGAVVTIAPGATITVDAKATLQVLGSLTSAGGGGNAKHAKLSGNGWIGIIVGQGGKLELDGVDLASPQTGIETQAGAVTASFSNGTITSAVTPVKVGAGTTLSLSHAVVVALGASLIHGKLEANYLDYTKPTSDAIIANDPAAEISIENSTLKGPGPGAGDYVVSQQGAKVHVAYTTITGAHCAFHFDALGTFDIEHVTAQGNSWGAMFYGSTGPNTISASNFSNLYADLDFKQVNGSTTIDGTFTTGKNTFMGVNPTITNSAANQVPGAHPQ